MNAIILFASSLIASTGPVPLQSDKPVVDHGEVKAGTIIGQTFVLKNAGPVSITIVDVETPCGCLRPRLQSAKLAPGQSTELRVEVNTIAQPAGLQRWTLTVRCVEEGNSERPHHLELAQTARIVREIQIDPVAVYLSIERETSHVITLTDARRKALTISEARVSHPFLRTKIHTSRRDANGRKAQQVEITVLDECPPGVHSDSLRLLTDDPAYRELRIPLTIARKTPGQIVATPETVTLRLAKGQRAASGLVRLRDPEDRNVIVDKLETDDPALRTKWAQGPGAMVTLRLGVEFAGEPASGIGSVRVFIREPKPQVLVIPVVWQSP